MEPSPSRLRRQTEDPDRLALLFLRLGSSHYESSLHSSSRNRHTPHHIHCVSATVLVPLMQETTHCHLAAPNTSTDSSPASVHYLNNHAQQKVYIYFIILLILIDDSNSAFDNITSVISTWNHSTA